jgi:hypothetical protein
VRPSKGKLPASKAGPPRVLVLGTVSCKATGETYRLGDVYLLRGAPSAPAVARTAVLKRHYEADTLDEAKKFNRMWRSLELDGLHWAAG